MVSSGSIGMQVRLDDAALVGLFARMRQFPERQRPMWDAMGSAMVDSTKLNFVRGRDPQGSPWLVSQRVKKHGGQTLVLQGYLRDSAGYNVLANGFEWGEARVYAGIHQTGGTIHRQARDASVFRKLSRDGSLSGRFVKRKHSNFEQAVHVGAYDIHIPARPSIGIGKDDVAELESIEARHLGAAILGGSA